MQAKKWGELGALGAVRRMVQKGGRDCSKLKIGIDVRALSRPHTGIYRYLVNVLREMGRIDTENDYFLYSDREFDSTVADGRWRKRIRSRFNFLPGSVWQQTECRKMAVEDGLNVFWGPAHSLPLGLPDTIRKVVTVHDLVWRAYPETMSAYNRLVTALLVEKSLRQADALVADSNATKHQVEQCLAGLKTPTRVVHLGVEDQYRVHDRDGAAEYIAGRFGTSREYICAVGTIEPRKNLVTLIEAFQILREKCQFVGQLLIVGGQGWGKSNVHRKMLESGLTENEVKFLGFVPEAHMPWFYSGSLAFVFTSIYEGFGLPVLEAMACGAPVVASNISSIPEVVGNAGILVDPQKPAEFAEAISRIRSDPALAADLSLQGRERARLFSWEVTARETLETLTEHPTT